MNLRRLGDYNCQLYGAHIEYNLNILFLHLDDDKIEVSNAVATAITALGELDHEKVVKYAGTESKNMRNPKRALSLF